MGERVQNLRPNPLTAALLGLIAQHERCTVRVREYFRFRVREAGPVKFGNVNNHAITYT